MALALGISMLQPRTYTATARIVIEPPAGSDPRGSMVISPVYLELLRTYEVFASSDDLFLRGVQKFGLRQEYPGTAVDRLKRSVLRVEVPRNTKLLEVSARLRDPRKAQALALFIAEETVRLNNTANLESDREFVREAELQLAEARARLETSNLALSRMESREPVQGLASRLYALEDLRSKLQQELLAAELDSAGDRTGRLRAQVTAQDREIAALRRLLAARSTHREELASEQKDAQTALAAVETRLRELRSSMGYRGDRLRVIDPGIVPERPSSPNIPLNLIVALGVGAVLAILLVSIEFTYRLYQADSLHRELRAGRVND